MADRRYRGGYGYGIPQSQSPWHDPYQKGPAWGRGIRELLNNMMMMKQLKEERGEKEWERKFEEEKREMEQRDLESLLEYRGAQTERLLRPPAPPKVPDYYQKATDLVTAGVAKNIGEGLTMALKIEQEPKNAYTLKKRDLDKALKLGTINQEQYNKALFNLKQELSPEEKRRKGATIRDANARELRDFYKGIPELIDKGRIKANELRKMIEKQGGGIPTSQQGYRLDMPEQYNRAILNQRDGVATAEDKNTIKNYEDMFKIFQDELKDYPTFKDWISSSPTNKLVGLDKNQMKIWYDIYAEKEKFLGIF